MRFKKVCISSKSLSLFVVHHACTHDHFVSHYMLLPMIFTAFEVAIEHTRTQLGRQHETFEPGEQEWRKNRREKFTSILTEISCFKNMRSLSRHQRHKRQTNIEKIALKWANGSDKERERERKKEKIDVMSVTICVTIASKLHECGWYGQIKMIKNIHKIIKRKSDEERPNLYARASTRRKCRWCRLSANVNSAKRPTTMSHRRSKTISFSRLAMSNAY